MEPYAFQNVYVITTYRCNWDCAFCLFKHNKEEEADESEILSRIEFSIQTSDMPVYIKITGGEPFLKLSLMEKIFELAEQYEDDVYKIGIGTNGSIPLPAWFNDVTTRTHIFLSRHGLWLDTKGPKELAKDIDNDMLDFRVNCNLIKGLYWSVDTVGKMEYYIDLLHHTRGITHFCFRELSKVSVDDNFMYPEQIYDYQKYYDERLIRVSDIEEELKDNPRFEKSRVTGNYYDTNNWYWYKKDGQEPISVKFRTIDETRLIEYNRNTPGVDEFVVHPDGTLTGCWDKEMKLIVKGGASNAESTIHYETLKEEGKEGNGWKEREIGHE